MPDLPVPSLKKAWLFAVLCGFLTAVHAQNDAAPGDAAERIVWRKAPIELTLVAGEERLVHFPDSVRLGLPQSLASTLQVQSIHGTLYLQARKPFEATRVLAYTQPDGPIYVLDIEAVAVGASLHALADIEVVHEPVQAGLPEVQGEGASPWGYVALTRFAAQSLYAPERLLPGRPGVVAVPVDPEPVDLLRAGPPVQAIPVAAWKAGPHYVTAVQLSNLAPRAIVLDPRVLQGAWRAATFQHNRLMPQGHEADTTTVYLVSTRPFETAR